LKRKHPAGVSSLDNARAGAGVYGACHFLPLWWGHGWDGGLFIRITHLRLRDHGIHACWDCIHRRVFCHPANLGLVDFLLGGKNRIDAASFWLNEGATTRDIEGRLRNGEFLK
jgi:hypothetical protein